MTRVFVAVDVNNLWHSCRQVFGADYRVSFQALKDLISKLYQDGKREFTFVAYAITLPYRKQLKDGRQVRLPPRNARFLESMEKMGYLVKTRQMEFAKGEAKPFGTDWDVGITIDALDTIDTYDVFVLVSGDGDYSPLLNNLRAKSKRIEVVTFKKATSQLLYTAADSITYLGLDEVFVQERNHGPANKEDATTSEAEESDFIPDDSGVAGFFCRKNTGKDQA